ncbi:MAG: putative O-glycosylation ligase, exosortase A system-associated, partial [Alphaproteobacteria bacterium]
VGIAFQPYIYFLIAVEISFDRYVQTYVKKKVWNPFRRRRREVEAEAQAQAEREAADAAAALAAEQAASKTKPERRRTQARWGSVPTK